MGKASSSKKVSRAARVGGGGRRARSGRSYFWPGFISVVVVLGTIGVVFSRQQNQSQAAPLSAPSRDPSPPRVGDHWHTAYGVNICGKWAPSITEQTDPVGIHTHADGVIHVHPFQVRDGNPFTGRHATLGAWLRSIEGVRITATEIDLPGRDVQRNGMRCNGKAGQVRAMTWKAGDPPEQGTPVTGNPSDVRLLDRMLLTVAFLPADAPIPQPPTAPQLDRLTDVGPTDPASPPASAPTGPEPLAPTTPESPAPATPEPPPTSTPDTTPPPTPTGAPPSGP